MSVRAGRQSARCRAISCINTASAPSIGDSDPAARTIRTQFPDHGAFENEASTSAETACSPTICDTCSVGASEVWRYEMTQPPLTGVSAAIPKASALYVGSDGTSAFALNAAEIFSSRESAACVRSPRASTRAERSPEQSMKTSASTDAPSRSRTERTAPPSPSDTSSITPGCTMHADAHLPRSIAAYRSLSMLA